MRGLLLVCKRSAFKPAKQKPYKNPFLCDFVIVAFLLPRVCLSLVAFLLRCGVETIPFFLDSD